MDAKKILIVDDSKDYVWIISKRLEQEGFAIATAENGEEGLEAVAKENPDLILLDMEMPKMGGLEMSKKLQELGVKTPIIFLTNLSDLKHVSEAVQVASDYVVKADITADDIAEKVKGKFKIIR